MGLCHKSLSSFLAGPFRDWKVLCDLPGAFTSPGIDTDVIRTLILSLIFIKLRFVYHSSYHTLQVFLTPPFLCGICPILD